MNKHFQPAILLVYCSFALFTTASAEEKGVKNSIGMKLVQIRAGEFGMGSPNDEPGRREDEPRRHIIVTRDYILGQYEVTRGQFRLFVEKTGYRTDCERNGQGGWGYDEDAAVLAGPDPKFTWRVTGFSQTDEHPVVNVSWNDAVAFCEWLSKQEEKPYRLPTEAEWEYACRASTSTPFFFGSDPEQLAQYANTTDAGLKKKFAERIAIAADDGHVFTAPVGSYKANGWGLFDMAGNVWEWTADWYEKSPSAEPQTDPQGPATGTERVIKGGDWFHDSAFARSASRFPIPPGLCRRHAGFRVVQQ
jgi:formylglycine-generating enzyme required for sulfatase activity